MPSVTPLPRVVLRMSDVRALLSRYPDDGGPCRLGVSRLLRRFAIPNVNALSATMLRAALEAGGLLYSGVESQSISWGDYSWFIASMVPYVPDMLVEMEDAPLGEEWKVLCQYITLEVVDE